MSKYRTLQQLVLLAFVGGLMSACGGGGGTSTSDTGTTAGTGTSGNTSSSSSGSTSSSSSGSTSSSSSGGSSSSSSSSNTGSSSGSTTATGTALECFTKMIPAKSTQTFSISGVDSGTSTVSRVYNASSSYQGNAALEIDLHGVNTLNGVPPSTTDSKVYSSFDGNTIIQYGAESTTVVQTTPSTTSTQSLQYTPAWRDDMWTLSAGQEITENAPYTSTTTTSTTGTTTVNGVLTRKVRYDGREMVTVPAGTYNACKFTINDTVTQWYEPTYTSIVKTTTINGDTTEMTSGTVNGVPY